MLGSLARKLRAVGFDTSYFKSGPDSVLLALAADEGRVILTADRTLVKMAQRRGLPAMLVSGRSDAARLKSVVEESKGLGLRLVRGGSLCSLCNGALKSVARSDLRGKVPDQVLSRHRVFYECTLCGKVYWKGGHWKKLRSLAARLREK